MLTLVTLALTLHAGTEAPLEPPTAPSDAGVELLDGGASLGADGGVEAEVLISSQPALFTRAPTADGASALHIRVRLGFLNEWGNHPNAPLGLSLGLRVGGEAWSGILEAWGLLPDSLGDTTDTGSLSVGSFGGLLGLCYEHAVLSGALLGCVLARGGAMRFEPRNLPDLAAQWQPVGSAGLRFGGEWPRDSFLAFYVTLSGFVPIVRGALSGSTVSWTQRWLHGGAQVGFRLRFE